jgi:hypothetical protein
MTLRDDLIAAPDVKCKGLTFLPVPEFDGITAVFGAPEKSFFNRRDLPQVPLEFANEVSRLFYRGGVYPAFGRDVDAKKAKIALSAWLSSFEPAHEAKVATVAYALWVWSPAAADARAAAQPVQP